MKIAFVQDGMCFDAGFCPMGDLENTIFRFGHVTKSMVVPFRYGQTDHAGQSKNVDSAGLQADDFVVLFLLFLSLFVLFLILFVLFS